jgi:hypothetical protein
LTDIHVLGDTYLIALYIILAGPSVLVAKETRTRLRNLRSGASALLFLPLTATTLVLYAIFANDFISQIPLLNLSWLGYNIALGPFADKGVYGILPFIPMLVYMLIHVNYFEEFLFRKSIKRVIIWAFMHLAMGVAIYVVLVLLPSVFFTDISNKYSVNHAYTLHLATNLILVTIAVSSYFLLQAKSSS